LGISWLGVALRASQGGVTLMFINLRYCSVSSNIHTDTVANIPCKFKFITYFLRAKVVSNSASSCAYNGQPFNAIYVTARLSPLRGKIELFLLE
jgi:hypothetical protein